MSNYVNGVSYPLVKVLTVDNEDVETITLDLCGRGGLVEEYTEDFKRVVLENNSTYKDYDFRGSRIKFILDYSEYVRADNLEAIENIFFYNSLPDEYVLKLIPRADALRRQFTVRLDDGAYSLGIHTGGTNTVGHRLPLLVFVTVNPVGKNFIFNPLDLIFRNPYRVLV